MSQRKEATAEAAEFLVVFFFVVFTKGRIFLELHRQPNSILSEARSLFSLTWSLAFLIVIGRFTGLVILGMINGQMASMSSLGLHDLQGHDQSQEHDQHALEHHDSRSHPPTIQSLPENKNDFFYPILRAVCRFNFQVWMMWTDTCCLLLGDISLGNSEIGLVATRTWKHNYLKCPIFMRLSKLGGELMGRWMDGCM